MRHPSGQPIWQQRQPPQIVASSFYLPALLEGKVSLDNRYKLPDRDAGSELSSVTRSLNARFLTTDHKQVRKRTGMLPRGHGLRSGAAAQLWAWPRTPSHLCTHPGSEAFYVLAGRLGQRTPPRVSHADAGQTMNGHGADTPMEVFSAGTIDLNQIVLFVVDATRPFSSPAKLE